MVCKYCGYYFLKEDLYLKHVWNEHKEKDIERVIVELDYFIRTIAVRFINRYGIAVEIDEIMQYLRTSIFLILRNKYDPERGKPTYFAKASCNNFLKRFIQEYYYKRNALYRGQGLKIANSGVDDRRLLGFSSEDERSSDYVVIDYPSVSPLDTMMVDDLKFMIIGTLNEIERSIFKYITDPHEKYTQSYIASCLNISQPLVSYKVKIIRQKTEKILSTIKY